MKLTITVDGEPRTVELPEEVVEALMALAERHRISVEEMIAQAVVNQKALEDQIAAGNELLLKKGDRLQHLAYA